MANLILDYYCGEDLYSDGSVEELILEAVRNQWDLMDLDKYVNSDKYFAFLYHLSPIRENILNWYPFKEGCRILEVGSGCGAITGLLCQKAGWVTSVELSRQRATINYERNKDAQNLEIMVGNLNDLPQDDKYDYVILNGVLEYACSFTEGAKPFHAFLKSVRGFLKPHGILLTAIENRLGAKYFAGAPEDHTDRSFWGVREYPQDNSVRTFSKHELSSLLRESGYEHQRFYYPFPDYKFPSEIFTDDSIKNGTYGKRSIYFEKYYDRLFEEDLLEKSLSNEGIMDRFVNSFLVEASPLKLQKTYVSYAKLNLARKTRFAIGTSIQKSVFGRKSVVKYALKEEAVCHIRSIDRNNRTSKFNLRGSFKGDRIRYPFLKGKNLNDMAAALTANGQIDDVLDLIKEATDKILENGTVQKDYYTEQFVELFGSERLPGELECISDANIDLILDNIFVTAAGYKVIDCEWYAKTPVPRKFIIWRTLNEFFYQNPEFGSKMGYPQLLMHFDISEGEDICFRNWADHFAQNYVSDKKIWQYVSTNRIVEATELSSSQHTSGAVLTSLYIDSGQGFSEKEKVWEQIDISEEGDFTVVFDLSRWEKIKALRWDPLENEVVKCENISVEIDGKPTKFQSNNSESNIDGLFMTMDPQYICTQIEKGSRKMLVYGKLLRLKEPRNLIKVYQNSISSQHPLN